MVSLCPPVFQKIGWYQPQEGLPKPLAPCQVRPRKTPEEPLKVRTEGSESVSPRLLPWPGTVRWWLYSPPKAADGDAHPFPAALQVSGMIPCSAATPFLLFLAPKASTLLVAFPYTCLSHYTHDLISLSATCLRLPSVPCQDLDWYLMRYINVNLLFPFTALLHSL